MRLIDADEIVKVAEHAFNEWTLAMVGADDTRKVNEVFKKQYLCKVVKAIAENAPTVNALVLPCKVGDAVYMEIGDDETPHFVDTGKVFAIGIDESGTMWISVRYESGLKFYHPSDDIGKTVFLTREEAEAALAKMG